MPFQLVPDQVLEETSVVANSTMNRERGLNGVNSYQKDLGIDVVDLIEARLGTRNATDEPVAWLDLCCGSGRALADAAARFVAPMSEGGLEAVGVDLVDQFDPAARSARGVTVVGSSWSCRGRIIPGASTSSCSAIAPAAQRRAQANAPPGSTATSIG